MSAEQVSRATIKASIFASKRFIKLLKLPPTKYATRKFSVPTRHSKSETTDALFALRLPAKAYGWHRHRGIMPTP